MYSSARVLEILDASNIHSHTHCLPYSHVQITKELRESKASCDALSTAFHECISNRDMYQQHWAAEKSDLWRVRESSFKQYVQRNLMNRDRGAAIAVHI